MKRQACTFCLALQRIAIRRRDVELIEAAEHLSAEHLAADAEGRALSRVRRRDNAGKFT